ncbi:hypothetical protein ACRALDRAFT_2026913 [Sodiomyces alcalophilus JCM 7366]|uniref:uncharacterized protein n=1 Tax=Sodiomyces alcalophilus JCM 7366 TaxID=591952 RepID=UPI0039B52C76
MTTDKPEPGPPDAGMPTASPDAGITKMPLDAHPAGRVRHGRLMQILRGLALALYLNTCCVVIFATQVLGSPLYWINREIFYSYIALTKQSFALAITTVTQWWGPTTVRISGDASVAGQIKKTPDGLVQFDFPLRMVMIANHQIYTDWIYLWWVGYANSPSMHGHIYIILKESLKYIPIVGWGMMFYGFIFMSRKMATDQPRLAYRLNKLKALRTGAHGEKYLDPMWLLLFPEGTNLSANGRRKSAAWAVKAGLRDPEHVLLPRSTGMYFCLRELRGTIEYIYDCTVAYEGIPRGKFGEQYFTLSSTYFQGRPPKSVNFHWRRFRVDEIPLEDQAEFDLWLRERWYEKDALMETYLSTGRFPPLENGNAADDYIETEVRTKHWYEFTQIFVVVGTFGLVARSLLNAWSKFR